MNTIFNTKTFAAAAALFLTAGFATANPNLIVNGGFENGRQGWGGTMEVSPIESAHSGAATAFSYCWGTFCTSRAGAGSFLAQTVATTAGATYNLRFWIAEDTGPTGEMSVFWDGKLVTDIVDPANASPNTWKAFSFDGLTATSSSTVLEIHGRQDNGDLLIDDVSLVAADGAALRRRKTAAA